MSNSIKPSTWKVEVICPDCGVMHKLTVPLAAVSKLCDKCYKKALLGK